MKIIWITILLLSSVVLAKAQTTSDVLSAEEVHEDVRSGKSIPPLFKKSLAESKRLVDKWIVDGILVPTPKDMAGGYSHEVHKRNFLLIQQAGFLYQLTGDEQYFKFLRKLFLTYAKKYPTFGIHPSKKSYAPGKLFWQALNDANWLVFSSKAYASIRENLSNDERNIIENDFLRPYADYISLESPQFFNRVHNHSTWGNAGVGMLALALKDEALLQRALYGLPKDVLVNQTIDNDGGDIKAGPNGEAGFYAQLDNAFSPDGYYSEGPYYQRYAMLPFIVFAKALEEYDPSLKIFEYRDGLLKKAVHTLVSLTDEEGTFYPINDAQKGMSIRSRELIAAVDAVYFYCGQEVSLLTTAEKQQKVQLDATGFAVAKALNEIQITPPLLASGIWKDGKDGTGGGIATLRSSPHITGRLNAVFKFGVQGMGHGHFDRLSYALYAGKTEVLQDYGAARWVNIDQKGGGRYLPENKTWAKQTIAHNTVVLGETSQFNGSTKTGEEHPSEAYFFEEKELDYVAVSAKDNHAYPGAALHRTVAILQNTTAQQPLWIDIFRIEGASPHRADLPFHFASQLMTCSTELTHYTNNLQALGTSAGYQHAFLEGNGVVKDSTFQISWFSDGKFFSQVSISHPDDSIVFGRVGANDPNSNLRRDPFFIHRKPVAKDHLFVSVIASHGIYDPVSEIATHPYVNEIVPKVLLDSDAYTGISISYAKKTSWTVLIANQNNSSTQVHTVEIDDRSYIWKGPLLIKRND